MQFLIFRCAFLVVSVLTGMTACSVSHVDVRLERDLSGTFKTIMSVDRQIEACAGVPAALQELTMQALAADSDMEKAFKTAPYNAGGAGGVQAAFKFENPADISLRIGQLQRLRTEPGDRDEDEMSEASKEFRKSLGQIDSLPVDFEQRIEPVVRSQGEIVWHAEFEGDPSVLARANLSMDKNANCSPNEISFAVTMPAPIKAFSPISGRATGVRRGTHGVVWTIPREGGKVLLSITASEPDPEWKSASSDWLSLEAWIAIFTLISAILGALVAWVKLRTKE